MVPPYLTMPLMDEVLVPFQNGKDIEIKCSPQAVILPARAFFFEIEAILTSEEIDPFCPLPRWQAWTEQNCLKPRRWI
jgi:hypothetical protein